MDHSRPGQFNASPNSTNSENLSDVRFTGSPQLYIVHGDVAEADDLSDSEQMLWGLISGLCNQLGYCWATDKYLAAKRRKSEREIQSMLRKLKTRGYIRIETKNVGFKKERKIFNNLAFKKSYSTEQVCDIDTDQVCEYNNIIANSEVYNEETDPIFSEKSSDKSEISESSQTCKVAEPRENSLASFDADLALEELIKQQVLPENKVAVGEIVSLSKKHNFKFTLQDIRSWLRKHGPYIVLETLKLLITRFYSKEGVSDETRWMQSALTKQFVKKERNRKENLAWAELFIQDYDYKGLEIKNKYCIDASSGGEVSLESEPETFKQKIKHFYGKHHELS